MPDKDGKLTDQELATVEKSLRKRGLGSCSCGYREWVVGDHVLSLPVPSQKTLFSSPYVPVVMVACAKCGQFRLYSARMAGIEFELEESGVEKEAEHVK